MTNPAVLSRKEVDNWCRELRLENKELKSQIVKLKKTAPPAIEGQKLEQYPRGDCNP